MKLTGFTDEASADIEQQIKITKQLGWSYFSARTVGSSNIHDISQDEFERVYELLLQNELQVAEFGTLIGNWSKKITDDFRTTQNEVERCIPRMKKLDVQIARIMSYAQEPWGENQYEGERFRRLRWIVERFLEADLIPAHENCMNWGGFSADHTLKMLEEVPGLQLIFDTGNPIFQKDRSKSEPGSWQNSYEFYKKIKHAIAHIHVKDAYINDQDDVEYVFPGEGKGYISEILSDLHDQDYDGFLAIEPHMGKVFHEDFDSTDAESEYQIYKVYAERFESLVHKINGK